MVDLTACEFCGADVGRESTFCPVCGVPGPGSTRDQRHEWVQRMGASPRGDGGALALKERPFDTKVQHSPRPPIDPTPPVDDHERWPEVIIEHHGNGLAVASLVLGTVGIVVGVIPILFFLSLPCGLLALTFGVVGRGRALADESRGGRRLALTGVILGCLTMILGVVGIVVLDDAANDLRDEMSELEAEIETFYEELNL